MKSWSYSRLLDFEQCALRYKLRYVDKVPGQKSEAADRGTALHQQAEDFVRGKLPHMPQGLAKFSDEFVVLREQFKAKTVSLEGEWGFTSSWEPTNYKTAWLRMKADAVSFLDGGQRAVVIDYKSGQRFGNEIKHGEQVQLYALATAIRNPKVQIITGELWYLDKDELPPITYTRQQAMGFIKLFDRRVKHIDDAYKAGYFPPRPNVHTCKYCDYGPNKLNSCQHGMTSSMTISDYRKRYS